MKLSQNFTLSEFTKSQTAIRHNIDNTPTDEHIENLRNLCENVLQPLRDHFKKSVTITSGYRSAELNKKIRGSNKSQHMSGEACDLEIFGISTFEVANWISQNVEFDQLILEHYTPGDVNSGWVHVSWASPARGSVLTAAKENGVTVYKNGLVV